MGLSGIHYSADHSGEVTAQQELGALGQTELRPDLAAQVTRGGDMCPLGLVRLVGCGSQLGEVNEIPEVQGHRGAAQSSAGRPPPPAPILEASSQLASWPEHLVSALLSFLICKTG